MPNSIEKLRAKKSNRKKETDIGIYDAQLARPTLSNIQIDEELRSYIPPLKPEELSGLEESIREEHVRDKLMVWQNEEGTYVLVDGHNRFSILQKLYQEGLKINYQTEIASFPNREAVKDWMINNQLGRRNLTPGQMSYLRGLRYNREKAKHGGTRKEASPQNEDLLSSPSPTLSENKKQNASPQNEDLKTSHRLASEFKVGKATIERDGQYAMGLEKIGQANADLKRSILAGETRLSKSIIQQLSGYEGSVKKLQNLESIRKLTVRQKINSFSTSHFFEKKKDLQHKIKELSDTSKEKDIQEAIILLYELKELLKED